MYGVQVSSFRRKRYFSLALATLLAATATIITALLPNQATAASADGGFLYTVRSGDSLWKLSQRFGTTITSLRQANHRWNDYLYVGEILWVPTTRTTNASAATVSTAKTTGWSGGSVAASNDDVMLLARLINAEARGESYEGQVAVGAVVLNRVRSSQFPNTISGVIYDPGQFEPASNGQLWLQPSQTALQAARDALAGWDPTGGALFFFNPAKSWSSFLWSHPVLRIIGDHYFLA